MNRVVVVILSLLLCAIFNEAKAQLYYTPMSSWMTMHSDAANVRATGLALEAISKGSNKSASAKPAKPAKTNYADTDFKSTGKRLMIEQFVSLAQSDDERKELRKSLQDFFNGYEKEVRKNNLGYALAFYLGANLQVATGKEISDADSELLAAECNNSLVSSGALKGLSEKEKQEMYELLVLTTGVVVALNQHGIEANDDSLKQQAQDLAKKSLEQFGFKSN